MTRDHSHPATMQKATRAVADRGTTSRAAANSHRTRTRPMQPKFSYGQTIQRIPVRADVVWGRTHVVKETGGSLFGGDDFQEGEIGPLGELTAGQQIVIEDDDIFISRRGANQEEEQNRSEQGEERPSTPWVRVLRIRDSDVTGLNVYVRAETVRVNQEIGGGEDAGIRRRIVVTEKVGWDAAMELAVQKMETEWILIGGDRNKPKTEAQCSGDTWTQSDEGADVAHDLADPQNRQNHGIGDYQRTFIAHYEDDADPIAVMMLEMRQEDRQAMGVQHLYIRWLVGSPKRRGGGSALVRKAIEITQASRDATDELRVESARSAIGWYELRNFKSKYDSTHNDLGSCGCKFMTWAKEKK